MIVHLCLLLNLVVFLLVNCFDDPPPPRPRPRPPPVIVHQKRPKTRTEHSEKSMKKVKEEKIRVPVPKPTEPKMKTRECNDNETVDETPSQWGDTDAAFVVRKSKQKPVFG
ncbi:hypothetical protein GCK72_004229 [Caenorhabditis remanei]|uniref:Uncharacterized protein n=1 Tax=Caenorhabditis remanei TaxID=31234 RepID=A0A6A5HD25_CAERE|nr:hypothetical protein GCK72_004229 [Caenorhabditis remanei]KAF1764282.1 hypothetical protein GCK72_004229 [Caenorhabditis remanei]